MRYTTLQLQHSSCKHEFSIRVENSLDPDQMAADLDLYCFQNKINSGSARQGEWPSFFCSCFTA